jgi:cytochrome b561
MHDRYPLSMRIIHWLMAVLILTLLGVGLWMADLPADYPDRAYYYSMHKSFGIVALIFVLMRVINRAGSEIPELPYKINRFDENLSQLVHYTLYFLMIAQPICGFAMTDLGGRDVIFFGYKLPDLFHTNKELAGKFWLAHKYFGYALIVAISLHILGSLKHYLVDRINLFNRMW